MTSYMTVSERQTIKLNAMMGMGDTQSHRKKSNVKLKKCLLFHSRWIDTYHTLVGSNSINNHKFSTQPNLAPHNALEFLSILQIYLNENFLLLASRFLHSL